MSEEKLRQTLQQQRDTLTRLIREIDTALADASDTRPAMQPLDRVSAPPPQNDLYDEVDGDSRSRLMLMIVAGVVALALIAGVIWWASKDRAPAVPAVVETDTTDTTDTTNTVVEEEAPAPVSTLRVTPTAIDYGIIAKGTRATRQFEISNETDQPMSITVARSTCRCLYYEYAPVIPPKAKETITVTVDGAKAARGPLQESLRVSAKSDPAIFANFDVNATIR